MERVVLDLYKYKLKGFNIKILSLFFVIFFLLSCSNKSKNKSQKLSGPNCNVFKLRSTKDDVNLTFTKKLNVGYSYVNNTSYHTLIFYTLSKEHIAKNIVGRLSSQYFSFGGAFPGIHPAAGGCDTDLPSYNNRYKRKCQINLQFRPDNNLDYFGKLVLSYDLNNTFCQQVVDLHGTGVLRM